MRVLSDNEISAISGGNFNNSETVGITGTASAIVFAGTEWYAAGSVFAAGKGLLVGGVLGLVSGAAIVVIMCTVRYFKR